MGIVFAIGPAGIQSAAGFHHHAIGLAPRICFLEDRHHTLGIRPRGAGGDPFLNVPDLFSGKFVVLLWRHGRPIGLMRTCHRQIQRTGHRLARHQCRFLALTALQQSRPSAHIQIALKLFRIVSMTGEALNLEERLNLPRKQHISWHFHGIGP